MGPVLVFGHRNPDNDSICSAVAYAHLKNLTDTENIYLPARLGPLPPETAWAFERFGVLPPEEINHVHTRVRDVMSADVTSVDVETTMLDAGRMMRERNVRALPVLENGTVRGLINETILADAYLGEIEMRGFMSMPVALKRIVDVLDGTLLVGDPDMVLSGDVLIGAMEPETMVGYITEGDTLVVGDRVRSQPMALDAGVACLIVTGGLVPARDVLELARERGAAVVLTSHATFAAARLVNLSHTVGDVMNTDVLRFDPEMLLSEALEDLLGPTHREGVVVDDNNAPLGMVTRTNIARGIRRRVILVDHNEMAQSAPGIESADVMEVVDHHRIGDVQTYGPILFLNIPVGSTATVVAMRYEELGVNLERSMAGILLSAVLSDTVLLKSPTTTEADHRIAGKLAEIVGVAPLPFGLEMFKARSAGESFSAARAVKADLKEYRIGDTLVAIGQIETVELDSVMKHIEDIRSVMAELREARGYDLVLLMVTDVVREGSEIIAAGKVRLAERGLSVSLAEGSAWMPGVLSRKKQIAARLVDAVGR
ncbi:MAG: putative manganese-dependent inorganic diphosphatase [Coriobacteriia bacterium]|jgi:manganese-dependent inorganic pyrophosphatase|nr:putative manganese-dependent inorganic diphosphatase [Coriobacteriia bacterium]